MVEGSGMWEGRKSGNGELKAHKVLEIVSWCLVKNCRGIAFKPLRTKITPDHRVGSSGVRDINTP